VIRADATLSRVGVRRGLCLLKVLAAGCFALVVMAGVTDRGFVADVREGRLPAVGADQGSVGHVMVSPQRGNAAA
jgi:hypothetical protein